MDSSYKLLRRLVDLVNYDRDNGHQFRMATNQKEFELIQEELKQLKEVQVELTFMLYIVTAAADGRVAFATTDAKLAVMAREHVYFETGRYVPSEMSVDLSNYASCLKKLESKDGSSLAVIILKRRYQQLLSEIETGLAQSCTDQGIVCLPRALAKQLAEHLDAQLHVQAMTAAPSAVLLNLRQLLGQYLVQ